MRTGTKIFLMILLVILLIGIVYFLSRNQGNCIKLSPSRNSNSNLVGVLPPKEAPGSIDKRVNQQNINQTICVLGYTKTVRPSTSYTNRIKFERMREIGASDPSDYELDHLIPLEVGGCPDRIENLWLESYLTKPNARDKDKLENYLHKEVCEGKITLNEAQMEIANDWYAAYKEHGLGKT